jgi:hypothetical protein
MGQGRQVCGHQAGLKQNDVSGIYDLSKAEPTEERMAYFGANRSRYAERSALPGLIDTNIPFMISSARAVALPHHSHMSESYSINTADTQLSNQILEFMPKGR